MITGRALPKLAAHVDTRTDGAFVYASTCARRFAILDPSVTLEGGIVEDRGAERNFCVQVCRGVIRDGVGEGCLKCSPHR